MKTSSQSDLYEDAELASFYDLENGWAADSDFCCQMAQDADSILDLGCGTGELATHLAKTKQVTAVDPAGAMLDIAKKRANADKVNWVEGDATKLRMQQKFDLVLLTGHAFQVFLTPVDQLAALNTIAAHLSPTGRFVFDSRNPKIRAWERWEAQNTKRILFHPIHGETVATTDAEYDGTTGIVTYRTRYKSKKKLFTAESQIRFTAKDELAQLIKQSGLDVSRWYGSWQGQDWAENMPEIIPVGKLA